MSKYTDTQLIISTFAQKVDRLEHSSLRRFISTPLKLTFNCESDEVVEGSRLPDEEYLEAYILNLRFFIQDNEATSLQNMARLYKRECKDQKLIADFNQIRDAINSELDRPLWFVYNNTEATYRHIFKGMIYSQYAHANKAMHKLVQQMLAHPFGHFLALSTFLGCVRVVHHGLVLIKNLNASAFAGS